MSTRNPIAHAFHSNDVPRHQMHEDKRRKSRRVDPDMHAQHQGWGGD